MTAADPEPTWRARLAAACRQINWDMLALIVAAFWAVGLLWLERKDRRVDTALAHAERFISGEGAASVAEARHLLERRWHENPVLAESLRIGLAQVGEDRKEVMRHAFVADVIVEGAESPTDVRIAIARIADNLDLVADCAYPCGERWFCLRRPSCDRRTVRDQFCAYAQSFHRLYGGELEKTRKTFGLTELGRRSEAFAEGRYCR